MVKCVAWTMKGIAIKKLQDEHQGMAPGLRFGLGFPSFLPLVFKTEGVWNM